MQYTVECTNGYSKDTTTGRPLWITVWGDGYRAGTEIWDDGNALNSDGWTSSWQIEDGYVCSGGTVTGRDTWVFCTNQTEPNESKDEWIFVDRYSKTESTTSSSVIGGTVAASMIVNLGTSAIGGSSAQGMFSGIGQTQLLMTVPEIGSYIPAAVNKTFSNLDSLMLNFDFLSLESNAIYDEIEQEFGYTVNNGTRNLSIIKHTSSLLNLFHLFIILAVIFLFHIFMIVLLSWVPEDSKKSYGKILVKINDSFAFGFYIRFIMLIYLALLFTSLFELNLFIRGHEGKAASFSVAGVIAFFWLLTFIFTFVYWLNSNNEDIIIDEEKRHKCKACFSGLKSQKWKRVHILLFFLRRILISIILFLLTDLTTMTKLGMITGIQVIYLIILVIQRPFIHIKDQIIEIMNEVFYIIMIMYLFFFNDRNDWDDATKFSYLSLMFLNFIAILIISTGKVIDL